MKIVSKVTKALVGKLCWGVEWDRQLNLSMSLGEPKLRIREPLTLKSRRQPIGDRASFRRVTVKGEWWLWVFCAYWRIVIPGFVTATSSSSLRAKWMAMARLSGQRLKAIKVNANHGATEFTFDLGAILEVRRFEKDSDDDVWTLNQPNGQVLAVRGDGTFTYAKGTTPGNELVPMTLKTPKFHGGINAKPRLRSARSLTRKTRKSTVAP